MNQSKLLNKLVIAALIGMTLVVAILGLWWWIDHSKPLTSPLNAQTTMRFIKNLTTDYNQKTDHKVVYGYLPYWNFSKVELQPELTHLGYFSLTIAANGNLATTEDSNVDPGYHKLQSEIWLELQQQAQDQNADLDLVLTQFRNDDIVAFLNNQTAQDNLIKSLDSALLAYPFKGINLDIEYSGEVADGLRANYVTFTKKLHQHLNRKYGDINLSMAMYASAGTRYTIWDVEKLEPYLDHYVIMAYDFHRAGSVTAGPVAPLFGGDKEWDTDITENLAGFVKMVPTEKLLLGVPFYGYEWQTTSRDAQATTYPNSGRTASYARVQELLAEAATNPKLKLQEHWSDQALSPYITYQENGQINTIYYENTRSLSYKLDLVNQLNMGGIAIWALGYEGESRELWEVVGRKL